LIDHLNCSGEIRSLIIHLLYNYFSVIIQSDRFFLQSPPCALEKKCTNDSVNYGTYPFGIKRLYPQQSWRGHTCCKRFGNMKRDQHTNNHQENGTCPMTETNWPPFVEQVHLS